MTRPPIFQSLQRRQAHPVGRVAADLDSCAGRIVRPLRPPHPPAQKAPLTLGATLRGEGGTHSFLQCRVTGTPPITCGCAPVFGRNPHGSKAGASQVATQSPRVAPFSPRVDLFSPYVPFSVRGPSSSLLLLFLEERERKERGRERRRASTGLFSCNEVCPQVGAAPHRFSVAPFLGKSLVWRGVPGFWGGDPQSTGRNACVPPLVGVSGGAHGG